MDRKNLSDWFSNYQYKQDGYKHFSVLIPLIEVDGEMHVLYEVRSSHLRNQPNEICFPGGKREPNEAFAITAIRETCEELQITPDDIELIAQLDDVITPFNMYIHVYLGFINLELEEIKFATDEVAEIFTVPLSFLLTARVEHYTSRANIMPPEDFPYEKIQPNYEWKVGRYPILFIQFKDYAIWGITARITASFIETLKDLSS